MMRTIARISAVMGALCVFGTASAEAQRWVVRSPGTYYWNPVQYSAPVQFYSAPIQYYNPADGNYYFNRPAVTPWSSTYYYGQGRYYPLNNTSRYFRRQAFRRW